MELVASVTVPRVHLIANLLDEDAEGKRRRISQFAINPELRNGIAHARRRSCRASATRSSRPASRWRTTCARATGSCSR